MSDDQINRCVLTAAFILTLIVVLLACSSCDQSTTSTSTESVPMQMLHETQAPTTWSQMLDDQIKSMDATLEKSRRERGVQPRATPDVRLSDSWERVTDDEEDDDAE